MRARGSGLRSSRAKGSILQLVRPHVVLRVLQLAGLVVSKSLHSGDRAAAAEGVRPCRLACSPASPATQNHSDAPPTRTLTHPPTHRTRTLTHPPTHPPTRTRTFMISSLVFITNGPCCTMGSLMGRPAMSRKDSPPAALLLAST